MNKAILAPLAAAAAFVVGLVAAPLAQSQISDFVIVNADATNTLSMAPSAPLLTLANDLAPRFVVEYANTLKVYSIAPPSSTLLSLLGQTADRFVMQYANANRFYALGYPKDLFNDQTPPQISDLKAAVTTTISSTGLVQVTWLTNEVVTTTFEYGFAPGTYTFVITDALFFRLHEVNIADVPPDTTIYYRLHHSDRSGNVLQSQEFNVKYLTDTTPPQISDLTVTNYVTNSAQIRWTTNESATTQLDVGVQAGVYTRTITDTAFVTAHAVWLDGLTDGTNYFYRVQEMDRSGNASSAQVNSFRFMILKWVYVPLVRR